MTGVALTGCVAAFCAVAPETPPAVVPCCANRLPAATRRPNVTDILTRYSLENIMITFLILCKTFPHGIKLDALLAPCGALRLHSGLGNIRAFSKPRLKQKFSVRNQTRPSLKKRTAPETAGTVVATMPEVLAIRSSRRGCHCLPAAIAAPANVTPEVAARLGASILQSLAE